MGGRMSALILMYGMDGAPLGIPVGMILGSMAITPGGDTLIVIMVLSGAGDGVAIMPASIRLGMILGITAVSTAVTGVATGAVIGGITIIIRPTMRSLCVIMPMGDPALMAIIQLVEAAA